MKKTNNFDSKVQLKNRVAYKKMCTTFWGNNYDHIDQ